MSEYASYASLGSYTIQKHFDAVINNWNVNFDLLSHLKVTLPDDVYVLIRVVFRDYDSVLDHFDLLQGVAKPLLNCCPWPFFEEVQVPKEIDLFI